VNVQEALRLEPKTARNGGVGSGIAAFFIKPANYHLKLIQLMKKSILLLFIFTATGLISASAADVKETWEKVCGKCHGADGKGETKMGQKLGIKDLTDAKLQADLKDDQAFKSVKEGIKDSEGKIKMKPAENISDDEIKALVQYVRTLKN
jgi:cytochrome c553